MTTSKRLDNELVESSVWSVSSTFIDKSCLSRGIGTGKAPSGATAAPFLLGAMTRPVDWPPAHTFVEVFENASEDSRVKFHARLGLSVPAQVWFHGYPKGKLGKIGSWSPHV